MGPLVLAKNFSAILDDADTFVGDWIPMDPQFQNGTIHVHCQSLTPAIAATGFSVVIETSYDTVEANQVGTTINVTATGSSNAAISSNLASLVRLKITNGEAAGLFGILSVWLQPKSD